MTQQGTLYFYAGKMGAGKTTYSKALAKEINALYISEDEWLSQLYPEEIKTFDDYITYSSRIKPLLKTHIAELLHNGQSVVMDFPGNTIRQRTWFKDIISIYDSPHKLLYIKASDERCLKQIEKRRLEHPERNNFDTKEVFYQVTSYFQEPTNSEGFHIEIISK